MEKERLQQLLATVQMQERQAFGQLAWVQGKVAQLEELLAMLDVGWPEGDEDDSGDTEGVS